MEVFQDGFVVIGNCECVVGVDEKQVISTDVPKVVDGGRNVSGGYVAVC